MHSKTGEAIPVRLRQRLLSRFFGQWKVPFAGHREGAVRSSDCPRCHPQEPPGMTTRQELDYYESCASRLADQPGAVVDLGCWMGATACALARGVRRQATGPDRTPSPVHAIDRFIWEPWMAPFLPDVYCEYRDGESFLPEARRCLGDMSPHVELVQSDLNGYPWQHGPIKLLLVDAMKTEQLARSITERFFPFLVPRALLLHQDFKHYYTSWIHLVQYRLRHHLRFVHEVKDGGTVAFELLRRVTPEEASMASRFEDATDDEIAAAFKYSLNLVSPEGRPAIAAAHVMHFVHAERISRAREVLRSYANLEHAPSVDLDMAAELVGRQRASK